jgi:hypothetical protein
MQIAEMMRYKMLLEIKLIVLRRQPWNVRKCKIS